MIRLKHLSGSLQGRTAELAKPVLRIGRAPDCDVRFDQARDPKVSNHHAELLLEEGNWFVVDTASTNDTLINGRRVTKHRLASGDKLQEGAAGLLAPLSPEEASRGEGEYVPKVLAAAIVSMNAQKYGLAGTKEEND